jgi:uncharacterized protein YndB with AHSA1/START domain
MEIVHNFEIRTSVDSLYDAITSQKGINGWWAKDADVGQQVGEISKMRFAKEAETVEMHFRIDEMLPTQKVSWTCVKNPNPAWIDTRIDFVIRELGGSYADFTFTHGNWDPKWEGQLPYEQTKEGWKHFMDSIRKFCETGIGEPW